MLKKLIKSKVTKNFFWLVGGKIFQLIINFVVGILTARYLGPSNYGLISYGNTYVAFFASICTLGINSVLLKEIVSNPNKEGEVIGTTLVLRFLSSVFSLLTIVAIVSLVHSNDLFTILIVFLCGISCIFNIYDTFNYWFQSKLMSKKTVIASSIAYLVTSIYKVVLLITEQKVTLFALSVSIDYLILFLLLVILYKKNKGPKLTFSWEYGKFLLKQSCHFILPGLMVSIYSQTDKMMLKYFYDDAAVGLYSTASSLSVIWCFVLVAIIDSLTPGIMESKKINNHEMYIRKNKQLYAIVFYLSLIVSVAYLVFSDLFISVLYGEEYLGAIKPLKILTWCTMFSYLGVARNAWVVCENKQRYLIWIYIFSAVANVVLNLLLIPNFGVEGAAIASLISQIFIIFIIPLIIKDLRRNVILIFEAILLIGVFDNKK